MVSEPVHGGQVDHGCLIDYQQMIGKPIRWLYGLVPQQGGNGHRLETYRLI